MTSPLDNVRMTPNRELIARRGDADEEGLTPRALACLLRLVDGWPMRADDEIWLTDSKKRRPLAELVNGFVRLTTLGWQIARAVDAGDVAAYYRLTTCPEYAL